MSEPHVALIAAVARNGVIGRDNGLIWRLSSDLKRFKALTMGKPVVMGRKTFASLPPAGLPGRRIIVVTRTPGWRGDGVLAAHSIEEALRLAAREAAALGVDEILVAGGAEIYAQTIEQADRLYITEVDLAPVGDAWFSVIAKADWSEFAREAKAQGPRDEAPFAFVAFARKRA